MKKIILASLLAISCASASVIYAQTFPINRRVCWDPNPAAEHVTGYHVKINGTNNDVSFGSDMQEICFPFVISATGVLNIEVTATNDFGTSDPTLLTVTVSIPGKAKNVRIR